MKLSTGQAKRAVIFDNAGVVGVGDIKALALLSGGLDSALAVKVIQEQGIEVVGLSFISPFFDPQGARKMAEELGVGLHIIDISDEHLEMVKSPKYGYGKNINPCLDCHILMLKEAGKFAKVVEASFIITGEVLGQRPMSQRRDALGIVERDSGLRGLLLRPLSAKLLPITEVEGKGLVDREKLLALSGRGRRPQIELAGKYGVKEYSTPAGGCLLTDPGFARRMRDLLGQAGASPNDVELLKVGRHFRSSSGAKIIVGRDRGENERLRRLARRDDIFFSIVGHKGPLTLVRAELDSQTRREAASLCARYSDGRGLEQVKVRYRRLSNGEVGSLVVAPAGPVELGVTQI